MKSLISEKLFAIGFVFVGTSLFGANYYLKPGATDFSVPAGYTMDEAGNTQATSVPSATDEVIVPAGTFRIDVSSASFATLSSVARVRPMENAILEFTAAEGVTGIFNAPVNYEGSSAEYWNSKNHHFGKIVKKGLGTLVLASCGRTVYGSYNQDYTTGIDLQEGVLKLPQYASGDMYLGDLTMAEGTTLVTCGNLNNSSLRTSTLLRSLSGYGIVTNESVRASGQIFGPYARDAYVENVFHGRLCDPVRIWLGGRITHYGHDTGITQAVVVESNKGYLNDGRGRGVYSFEDVALLGSHNVMEFYGEGAGFHYFGGKDAVIDKEVQIYTTIYPAFIDAGWYGGLSFTGNWVVGGDVLQRAVSKWVVLTGSNTVPCVITGEFSENTFSGKQETKVDTPHGIFVQKLGSGTWRLGGTRNHGGGFAIEEGTLQFDSVAEKGVASALGNSTNLTAACSVRNPTHVDYAFSLGSTKLETPSAIFEFIGAKSCVSSTRPLVLKGSGGTIKASGTDGARLGFGDISAFDDVDTNVILGGENTKFNVAANITDGKGTVGVVKKGIGEWYLSGTNTFSGNLHVAEGILNVLWSKYSWFRFTVRQTGNRSYTLKFRQLALYDAKGIRQNICLKVKPPVVTPENASYYWPDMDWCGLEPGSFAYGLNEKAFKSTYDPATYVDQIFSDVGNTCKGGTVRFDGETSYGKEFLVNYRHSANDAWLNIRKETPASWIPFVMRLTNGAPEIASYDIESFYHTADTNKWPKIGSMEASVDGIAWDFVETNAVGEVVVEHDYDFSIPLGSSNPGVNKGNANRWFSDGTAQINWNSDKGTTARPGTGFPMRSRADIPMPLQNVRSVSVASGATLRASEPGIVLKALKVDSVNAGTIEGFTFAKTGTLKVVMTGDNSAHKSIVLPGTYESCDGLDNIAKWTLDIDGNVPRKYRLGVSNGKITLLPYGLAISIR